MIRRISELAKWAGPSLGLSVAGGIVFGLPFLWLIYWAFNTTGVWLYCDGKGHTKLRTQRWLKRLSMILVPTGLIGLLASGDDVGSPTEAAIVTDDGQGIVKAMSTHPGGMTGGGGGC